MMPRLFPARSGSGRTRARPEIWTNAADFKLRLDEYRTAARALVIATQGTDNAAIGVAMARTGRACKSCHDRYERED